MWEGSCTTIYNIESDNCRMFELYIVAVLMSLSELSTMNENYQISCIWILKYNFTSSRI